MSVDEVSSLPPSRRDPRASRPLFPIGGPLRRLVTLASARPALTVTLWLVVAAVMLGWSLVGLRFVTSMLHLLSPTARYVQRYEEYSRNFGEVDDMMVVVESPDPRRSIAFAERLVERVRQGPVRFHRLAYRVDPEGFAGQRLLYLGVDQLAKLRRTLIDNQDFLERFAARPGVASLVAGLRRRIDGEILLGMFDLGLGDEGTTRDLDVLRDIVAQLGAAAEERLAYHSPWAELLWRPADVDEGVFLSDDKRLLFIFADPVSGGPGFAPDRGAVEEIRRRIAGLHREFPDVQAGVTGGPALSSDEMTTAFRDSKIATVLAGALTLGVLVFAFRQVVKPLLMLVVLGLSVVVSLGIITLTIGHLTIFSVMFISMVVGLGIDYGIYVLFRYETEREGRDAREAVAVTAERSGPGIVLGALSAAVTFYVLTLTRFRGIQEFGFVAGTALLVALLAMLTLFPAVLVLVDGRPGRGVRPPVPERESRLLGMVAEHRAVVLVCAVVACGVAAWAVRDVGFDYNLMHLQARGTESVRWEQRIVDSGTRSVFGALDEARSIPELRAKEAAFRRLPSVADVDSVTMLIPDHQTEKLALLARMRPLVAGVRAGPRPPMDAGAVIAEIGTLARRLSFVADQAPRGETGDEVRRARREVVALRARLATLPRGRVARGFAELDRHLYDDFRHTLATLQAGLAPTPVTPETVPEELRRKFVGKDGRYLLEIYPRVDTWERRGAERFVEDLRSVAPDVTGTPIVSYESIHLMEMAYREGTLYALLFVSALAFVILGRGRYTVLGLVPFLLGTLWAVALMPLFGLRFNLSNVWGLPLIIGASAEYGLNLVMRFAESRARGGPVFARSTVSAVLLNGVTTMVGFGSLLVAHHRGIWSLGLLLTLGSCTGLAAALLVLPALLRLFTRAAP